MGGDGFLSLMNQTLEETMLGEGFSQIFLNDIVAPITRVNYGQSVRINAFVGECLESPVRFSENEVLSHCCLCLWLCRGCVLSRG